MTLLVALLFGGFPFTVSARPPAPQAHVVIERHKVGTVVIGASAEDVYEAFAADQRRLVDLGKEGQLTPALELTLPGAATSFSVAAELGCDRGFVISRIFIKDRSFRTSKGIGVGSSVAELRAAYELSGFSTEEGGAGVVARDLSATFELDQTGADLTKVRTAAGIPNTVRIIGVLLWQ